MDLNPIFGSEDYSVKGSNRYMAFAHREVDKKFKQLDEVMLKKF